MNSSFWGSSSMPFHPKSARVWTSRIPRLSRFLPGTLSEWLSNDAAISHKSAVNILNNFCKLQIFLGPMLQIYTIICTYMMGGGVPRGGKGRQRKMEIILAQMYARFATFFLNKPNLPQILWVIYIYDCVQKDNSLSHTHGHKNSY